MTKVQVMRLVYESNLNKYEKLFLLDFIYNEPEEVIPFVIQEFSLKSISKALKGGKKVLKKAYKSVEYNPLTMKAAPYIAAAGASNIAGGDWSTLTRSVGQNALSYAKKKGLKI
jgi:hypothetical protein